MSAGKPGHPAADIDGRKNAAIWLLHLDPDAIRVTFLTDVAGLLLTSKAPAVQRVVGAADSKRLRNVLAPHRHAVLTPDWHALAAAILWAWKAGLPVIPMEKIGELPQAGVFPRTYHRLQQFERDEWEFVFALVEREDTLSAAAWEALGRAALRRLRRMRELADELGLP
jgi:hypothetical protein